MEVINLLQLSTRIFSFVPPLSLTEKHLSNVIFYDININYNYSSHFCFRSDALVIKATVCKKKKKKRKENNNNNNGKKRRGSELSCIN